MFTLDTLAQHLNARLEGDGALTVTGVSDLSSADKTEISAYLSGRWKQVLQETQARAIIIAPHHAHLSPKHVHRLVTPEPRRAWAQLLRLFHPQPQAPQVPMGVDRTAIVSPTAEIDHRACIGPYAVIEPGVRVHSDVVIGAFVFVGAGSDIGSKSILMPHACILEDVHIGQAVWVGSHTTIGSTGFGLDEAGRLPHTGRVIIEDGASIGAHTCIDKGTVGTTRIGTQTHIDNHVQVGHNVQVGAHVVICGQVGIAGSAVIEDYVVLGGQAGITGHVTIGERSRIAAQSGVTKSLSPGGAYSGHPAEPNRERLRREALRRQRERL